MSDRFTLEESTEIEVGNAGIPKVNLVIYAILIIICLSYLVMQLKGSPKNSDPKESETKTSSTSSIDHRPANSFM